jgi:hypothetical protein
MDAATVECFDVACGHLPGVVRFPLNCVALLGMLHRNRHANLLRLVAAEMVLERSSGRDECSAGAGFGRASSTIR